MASNTYIKRSAFIRLFGAKKANSDAIFYDLCHIPEPCSPLRAIYGWFALLLKTPSTKVIYLVSILYYLSVNNTLLMNRHSAKLPPNEEAAQILQRYDVTQAHNLVYTYEELRDLGIQPEFLLALLDVFEDQESFSPENFNRFSLSTIVDYLRKTHTYYMNKKLLEIEQSILLLVSAYPSAHPILLLLHNFYTDYKNHLVKHIEMEERELLPYIAHLEKVTQGRESSLAETTISVRQFIDSHHDTEKDLQDVRTAILSYSPPAVNQTLYRILLSQLQVFEKDMAIHALMEDHVLLPRALELETKFRPS